MRKFPFIKNLILTQNEKSLVSEICKLELEAVTEGITDPPNKGDIAVYEHIHELPQDSIIPLTWRIVYAFDFVKDNPEQLLMLEEDYLSIFKHILFYFEDDPEYDTEVRSLLRKLNILEKQTDPELNYLFQN